MKKLLVFALCALMLLSFVGCNKKPSENPKGTNAGAVGTPAPEIPQIIQGEMTIKDYGLIKFELYPTFAPQSVYNFVYLAKAGQYNGTIIHRIVKDTLLQTGAYASGFVKRTPPKGDYTIKGEFKDNNVQNDLSFAAGIMGWARVGNDYDSASTQFFICLDTAKTSSLTPSYAPFGKVTEGLDVLKKISDDAQLAGEKPIKEVMITLVTILNGDNVPEPDFIVKNG